ncbi:MAG: hypothetical protein M3R51_07945 [Candidatus Eremiobacteraeota bacterium]|nr:hypothetical protein [Candidatus Eremiobacteraeota bacterium]
MEFNPIGAGTATLTVTGNGGDSAQIAVTVTTISTMTVTLNGLPTATELLFAVSAPPNPSCASFSGGYMFSAPAPVPPSDAVTLRRFPAMGNGTSSACLFTTVALTVKDNAYVTLAQKTFSIPIALGKDNPTSISIP